MNKTLKISDSLTGSLCREIDYIRYRYKYIINSLINCNDLNLKKRLTDEIYKLKIRRSELKDISKKMKKESKASISKLFLYELCHRPIEYI